MSWRDTLKRVLHGRAKTTQESCAELFEKLSAIKDQLFDEEHIQMQGAWRARIQRSYDDRPIRGILDYKHTPHGQATMIQDGVEKAKLNLLGRVLPALQEIAKGTSHAKTEESRTLLSQHLQETLQDIGDMLQQRLEDMQSCHAVLSSPGHIWDESTRMQYESVDSVLNDVKKVKKTFDSIRAHIGPISFAAPAHEQMVRA